jgi:hypothetical protein
MNVNSKVMMNALMEQHTHFMSEISIDRYVALLQCCFYCNQSEGMEFISLIKDRIGVMLHEPTDALVKEYFLHWSYLVCINHLESEALSHDAIGRGENSTYLTHLTASAIQGEPLVPVIQMIVD